MLSIGGNNLQFYPNFALFSTLGGRNLDHDFVQVSKLSEDQKKVFPKNGTLFFPKFKRTPSIRCTPESNYWGDACVDHTQIIKGYTVKLLGDISPPRFRFLVKTFFFFEITCFWPEKPLEFLISARKSFRISAKTFFLIFSEKSPHSISGTMKIWLKYVYGITFQKILATCLFFSKVQSTLKKRPPMQNFTI